MTARKVKAVKAWAAVVNGVIWPHTVRLLRRQVYRPYYAADCPIIPVRITPHAKKKGKANG